MQNVANTRRLALNNHPLIYGRLSSSLAIQHQFRDHDAPIPNMDVPAMTKRDQYIQLREQGLSYAKIARLFGVDPSMVWKAIHKEVPPRRKKDPSKVQIKTRKMNVFAPIKCEVCKEPIVIGEQYVNDTGHETHLKCVCSV